MTGTQQAAAKARAGREDRRRPYHVEFPHSVEKSSSQRNLERALDEVRYKLHRIWIRDFTNEYSGESHKGGDYCHPDAKTAVITNRDTGYRWIVRRDGSGIEFETPEQFADKVGGEYVDIGSVTVAELEALVRTAPELLADRPDRELVRQVMERITLAAAHIREQARMADEAWQRYQLFAERYPGVPRDQAFRQELEAWITDADPAVLDKFLAEVRGIVRMVRHRAQLNLSCGSV